MTDVWLFLFPKMSAEENVDEYNSMSDGKIKKQKKHKSSSRSNRTHSEERLFHGAVLGDEFYEGRAVGDPPPSISIQTAGPLETGRGGWGTISRSSRSILEDSSNSSDKIVDQPRLTVRGLGVAAVDGRKRAARGGESEDSFSAILDILSPTNRGALNETGIRVDNDVLEDVTRSLGAVGINNETTIQAGDRIFHLLAVFDGHRAHHAARYCSEALASELAPRLESALQTRNEEEAVRRALGNAVIATDAKFCRKRFVSLVRDNGKKFYLTAVREVAPNFDINKWDTYSMEREWRVALDAATVAHGIRCGVRGSDLKKLAQDEQSRWHCYKKELYPGSALVAVLMDAHRGKLYCANVGDCMAALVYPEPHEAMDPSRCATPPPPDTSIPPKRDSSPPPLVGGVSSRTEGSSLSELRGRFNVNFPDINGVEPFDLNNEPKVPEFGRAILLSRPHKPADMCELKRVCSTPNGFVEVHGQRVTPENADLVAHQVKLAHAMGRKALYRINRDVSLSRAIGDFDLREFGVVASPDVTVFEMSSTRTSALLVIASDGVWDVMSSDEVVKLLDQDPATPQLHTQLQSSSQKDSVHEVEKFAYSCTQLAQSLALKVVNSAFGIKKNNDDVTAVVAALSYDPFPIAPDSTADTTPRVQSVVAVAEAQSTSDTPGEPVPTV